MSLINDALNKAQRDRSQPRGATLYKTPGYRPPFRPPVRVKSLAFIWVNAVILAGLFGAGIWYFRFRPSAAARDSGAIVDTSTSSPASTVTGVVPSTPTPEPQREPPTLGPLPLAAPAPLVPAPGYALTGMSALGSTTLLSIVRQSDKRSFWIPVGKTVGEITAVSYDAATDRAVIRVNGGLQTIALRDVGSPTSVPAATAAE